MLPSTKSSASRLVGRKLIAKSKIAGENAMDAAFDEVVSLKTRWKETHSKVKDRMREAMDDALSSKQEATKQNLLKFAEQFDSTCNQLAGDHGSLKEELLA